MENDQKPGQVPCPVVAQARIEGQEALGFVAPCDPKSKSTSPAIPCWGSPETCRAARSAQSNLNYSKFFMQRK